MTTETKYTLKTEAKHTPLPWKYELWDDKNYCADIWGQVKKHPGKYLRQIAFICRNASKQENEANAAFLVRACNNFENMLGALRLARMALQKLDECGIGWAATAVNNAIEFAEHGDEGEYEK